MTPLRLNIERDTASGRFAALLNGKLVVTSDQPLVDGARELLTRGYDPAGLLTIRHAGSTQDSFAPRPIREWAKWTYTDGRRLLRQKWTPRPECPANVIGRGKSGVSAAMAALHPHSPDASVSAACQNWGP